MPTRETINLRPDLKSEIINSVLEFTEQWGLGNLERDLKILFNFRLPKKSAQKRKIDINFAPMPRFERGSECRHPQDRRRSAGREVVGCSCQRSVTAGYDNIIYFNSQAKIISLSPKCIWTPYLLYRDLETCKKMGFVFGEF